MHRSQKELSQMTYGQILILRRDFTLASKRWAWLAANLGRGQRLDPISRKEMGSFRVFMYMLDEKYFNNTSLAFEGVLVCRS